MKDDAFRALLIQEDKRLEQALCFQSEYPENVKIVFNELLCHAPDSHFEDIFRFCKIDRNAINERKDPLTFFARCFDHEETPLLNEPTGYLINPTTGHKILGASGQFNPLAIISFGRAHKNDVMSWMTDERIKIALQILPAKAVEFWLNSTPDTYNDLTSDQLVDLVGRNVGAQ